MAAHVRAVETHRREGMSERGQPTGITRKDVEAGRFMFEGETAYVVSKYWDTDIFQEILELGFGDRYIRFEGYFNDSDGVFMAVKERRGRL